MSHSAKAQQAPYQNARSFTPIPNGLAQRKCACGGPPGLSGECSECRSKRLIGQPLQRKVSIGEPGDEYEREADRVADQIVGMGEPNQRFDRSERGAAALVQRRIADGTSVQRQEEGAGGQTPAENISQTEGGESTKDESPCPSWFNDPQSISKRAAEHYVRNDMTPPSQATVTSIDCEPPRPNGNYGCYVHFSDGLVIRVIVRKHDIVVGTAPINTLTPPPATPLCFYDYACPNDDLVLTKRECRSARPPGPTTIVQRAAREGASESMNAAPLVGEVLSSAGEPLDRETQRFFSARFGHDFGSVRVHADSAAAESARSIHALAYTVGQDIVFGAGQYAPHTRAGQRLLAHELTHVIQQGGGAPEASESTAEHSAGDAAAIGNAPQSVHPTRSGLIQRQPEPEPKLRDLPLFLDKLELDVGKNLLDYGHHLYQAAVLHPDEPRVLQDAFSRYALGLNVLKTSFRYAGFKSDTADKLAVGTGILFKGLTFVRKDEFVLDFQFDIGGGVKFETNIGLGVNPRDPTDVRKADIKFGFVRRF
jgi:hypothetical protein